MTHWEVFMNRNLIAGLVLALCLHVQAQTYDFTTSTDHRTTVESMRLTPDVQRRLDTEIHAQELEFGPVFVQERTQLWPILTPEQRTIYDQNLSARNYYAIGLMTPEEYRAWRMGFDTRLNLTPDQRSRYTEITSSTSSSLAPISGRYHSRYTAVLSPDQWNTYRTGVTRSYVTSSNAGGEYNSSIMTGTSESESMITENRSVETTEMVERRQTVETYETTPMAAPAPEQPTEQVQGVQQWRNQDLK